MELMMISATVSGKPGIQALSRGDIGDVCAGNFGTAALNILPPNKLINCLAILPEMTFKIKQVFKNKKNIDKAILKKNQLLNSKKFAMHYFSTTSCNKLQHFQLLHHQGTPKHVKMDFSSYIPTERYFCHGVTFHRN
jgi:hypothetical protein